MKSILRIVRWPMRFARSLVLAKRENERLKRELRRTRQRLKKTRQQSQQTSQRLKKTRQQSQQTSQRLKRMRQQFQQTRQQLRVSRRYLKQAEGQYGKVRMQSVRLGPKLKDTARAYLLCLMPKRSVCAEIGVHEGEFSKRIFDTVEPERLHLIDPWRQGEGLFGKQAARAQATMDERHAKVQALFAEEVAADRVRIHRNLSHEIVDTFDDSYFDWVYIDGNHLYEYVSQDLELYYPKVKAGGYLTGDDHGIRGFWDNGVQKAVDEFVSRTPGLTLEVQGTQFIIRKEASS